VDLIRQSQNLETILNRARRFVNILSMASGLYQCLLLFCKALGTRLDRLVEIKNLRSEGDGAFSDAQEGIDRGDEVLMVGIANALNLCLLITCES
jgi:hypothetical protein